MLQRLPLFLLVDASDTLERCHADTLNRALRLVINKISEDIYAVESVVISVIVFSGKSQVKVLHRFSYAYHCFFSDISPLGGAADYEAGFGALFREMTDGVVWPSESAPGDLRPLVFFFTAGSSRRIAGQCLSDLAAQDLRRNADVFSFVLSGKSDNSWVSRYSDRVYNIGDDAAPLESLLSKISPYVLKSSRAPVRQGFLSMMLYSENDDPKGKFPPYKFGGVYHKTKESLVKALLKNPASGIQEVRSGILTHHFSLSAPDLEKICLEAERNLRNYTDAVSCYQVFYRLMYQLVPELKIIFCGGQEFGSLEELGEAAISNAISGDAGFLSSLRLLQRSFLDFYARGILKSEAASNLLKKAFLQIFQQKCSDMQAAWILGYALSDKRDIRIGDKSFSSPEVLLGYLNKLESKQSLKYIKEHRAGLEFFAAVIPEANSREALKRVLKNLDSAVVRSGEYRKMGTSSAGSFDEPNKKADITVKGVKDPAVKPKPKPVFQVGEYVKFGNYPQNNGSAKEPIEWLVLEAKDNEALLVSRHGLDCKQYHQQKTKITWEDCDLRKWLNNEFLKEAFSVEEQQKIKLSEVANDDNRQYGIRGGNNTQDRVFCLSLAEAERYFKNNGERQCQPTAYARNQGAWVDNSNGCCYWRLRSPGSLQRCVSFVCADGSLNPGGEGVYYDDGTVRPALRLFDEPNKKAGITVKVVKYPTVKPKPKPVFQVGEYVKFGNYPQSNGSAKEPIEWLVLEVKDNEALLVSRHGLDCKQYHHQGTKITWEDCDLRKWLNNEFLKEAFSVEEQQKIKLSEVANDDNRQYGIRGGNNTRDHVFCLSLAEAERYFKNNGERQCQPTAHARKQGAFVNNSNGCCYWWLRSPGTLQNFASYVNADGAFPPLGHSVYRDDGAVRPALRLIWKSVIF